jgi:hypothetical protein
MTEEKINEACIELANVLKQKNKKYGDSFTKTADELGLVCIVIRLSDKLNRIKNILLKHEKDDMKGESVKDTLIDLAGYSILSKIYLDGKKY